MCERPPSFQPKASRSDLLREGLIGEDLADHRRVLNHAVEGEPLQAEEFLAFDELGNLTLKAALPSSPWKEPEPLSRTPTMIGVEYAPIVSGVPPLSATAKVPSTYLSGVVFQRLH